MKLLEPLQRLIAYLAGAGWILSALGNVGTRMGVVSLSQE